MMNIRDYLRNLFVISSLDIVDGGDSYLKDVYSNPRVEPYFRMPDPRSKYLYKYTFELHLRSTYQYVLAIYEEITIIYLNKNIDIEWSRTDLWQKDLNI